MFSISDKPGALYEMLEIFRQEKVNMTRIESRPSKRKAWDYIFFVDMEGHKDDEGVGKVLAALEKRCRHLELLGSYPASEVLSVPEHIPQEVAEERGG